MSGLVLNKVCSRIYPGTFLLNQGKSECRVSVEDSRDFRLIGKADLPRLGLNGVFSPIIL